MQVPKDGCVGSLMQGKGRRNRHDAEERKPSRLHSEKSEDRTSRPGLPPLLACGVFSPLRPGLERDDRSETKTGNGYTEAPPGISLRTTRKAWSSPEMAVRPVPLQGPASNCATSWRQPPPLPAPGASSRSPPFTALSLAAAGTRCDFPLVEPPLRGRASSLQVPSCLPAPDRLKAGRASARLDQ